MSVPLFPKKAPWKPVIEYPVTDETIEMLEEKAHTMRIRSKADSLLWRLLGIFWPGFVQRYWTTSHDGVWIPGGQYAYRHQPFFWNYTRQLQSHEAVHVLQFENYGILVMWLLYLGPLCYWMPAVAAVLFSLISLSTFVIVAAALLPLSVGLAWGRWYLERSAYLVSIAYGRSIDRCVGWLGSAGYGWCWPKAWMRAWFERHTRVSPKYNRGES